MVSPLVAAPEVKNLSRILGGHNHRGLAPKVGAVGSLGRPTSIGHSPTTRAVEAKVEVVAEALMALSLTLMEARTLEALGQLAP